jgi:hypothetical protein
VDWPLLDSGSKGWTSVGRLTDCIEQPAEYLFPDWRSDWLTFGAGRRAAHEPGCAAEGDDPHDCRAEVLLHFRYQRRPDIPLNCYRFVDRRQHSAVKGNVDDGAVNRNYAAPALIRLERLH